MKKLGFTILSFLLLILFLYKYGSSIYMPIMNKFGQIESVKSIHTKVSNSVSKRLQPYLDNLDLGELPGHIILVGLKEEQMLEVHVVEENSMRLLKKYPFTAFSGRLGPKLKEGDLQIPEGVYKIEYLNPNSKYYLSMKIDYPNEFDISKSKLADMSQIGNNIFIHGKAATIGCIPVGDEAIEELFLLVSHALEKGVKVIISPRDFRRGKEYPNIEGIDWEEELYDGIKKELNDLPKS